MTKKQKKMLYRILAAAVLFLAAKLIPLPALVSAALYFAAYLTVGCDILRKAWKGICNRQVFDENFLMAVATVGAIALALYERSGDYSEAVAVMLFYQIGELFQSYAVGKSRRSITALMDIRPDYANIERDGKLEQVDPDDVAVGTVIAVQPGEKVPIDGVVEDGVSTLNTAALTGESLPRDVSAGDEIISGCINMTGVLKVSHNEGVRRIHGFQNSGADGKFQRPQVPLRELHFPLCQGLHPRRVLQRARARHSAAAGADRLRRGRGLGHLGLPCADLPRHLLPLRARHQYPAQLLRRSSAARARRACSSRAPTTSRPSPGPKTVVFDKTGTLTQGVFEVSAVHHSPMAQEKLLEYAALAECASSHPISKSLQKAAGGALDRSRVTDIQEHSGRGVTAVVDGVTVAAGNGKLMEELGVVWHECHSVGTIVHIAVNGEYAGHIVISDVEKPHSRDAIAALKAAGVTKTVMLTGDIQKVADYVARDLGVDEVRAELLPADKVARVEELLRAEPEGAKLAFVGDGINDAPVLSRADIGIAMGAMGSDAAIEAADVVLMDDDPMKIAKAIKISRKCIRIVHENIVFSLGVKLLCLLLVALGFANMWMGIFADVGVMVLAVLNAIRALRVHNL